MITRTVRLRRTIFGLTLAMATGLVPVHAANAASSNDASTASAGASTSAGATASTGLSVSGTDGTDAAAPSDSTSPSTEPDTDSTTAPSDVTTTTAPVTSTVPDTTEPQTTAPATTSTTVSPATSAPETTVAPADSTTPLSSPDEDPLEGILGPDFEPSTPNPDFDPAAVAGRYLSGDNPDGFNGLAADGGSYANPRWSNSVMGGYVVRYDQQVEGIPVWGAGAAVRLDDSGGLLSISRDNPTAVPAQGLTPAVSTADASTAAIAATRAKMVADQNPAPADVKLVAEEPVLTVYDASLVGGDPNADVYDAPILVWDVHVTNEDHFVAYRNLVDAMSGQSVLSFSEQEQALNRIVCDQDNKLENYLQGTCKSVRSEGQPGSPVRDVNTGYRLAGFYYNSMKNRFGRDSYDGKGAVMATAVNVCTPTYGCPMQNAFWPFGGKAIFIGKGLAIDDVIFHEWTHAVTEHSANLLYYAESGAINESMSDVFGEIFDQAYKGPGSIDPPGSNWLLGEGIYLGDNVPPLRNMKNPTQKGDPDRVMSQYWYNGDKDNWGVHTNSGVNNKATYLIAAGGTFRGQTIKGLGNNKTLAIYYEALTGLMTPGTDYLDMTKVLPQACFNLVKSNKVTVSDCHSVKQAVYVTQMGQARARRYTAPTCTSGKPTDQFYANAEKGMYQFTTSASGGAKPWVTSTVGSQSGTHSYYSPGIVNTKPYPTSSLTMKYPVYVSKQQPGFLRFDHSHNFWTSDAGAVMEYTTDGRVWKDLGSVPGIRNGYSGTLKTGPLKGRKAFVGQSKGFEQVRVPLSAFAGKYVKFRWRYVGTVYQTESAVGDWMVDDVRVFSCGASAPTDTKEAPGRFQPVAPKRLFDTRPNQPATLVKVPTRRLKAGEVLTINMTDLPVFRYGDKVSAVALNVTAVGSDQLNHVTVFPCGSDSGTSTLNFGPGEATANAAIVPVNSNQQMCFKALKPMNLLADVTGYFATTRAGASTYRPLNPVRAFDTRDNNGKIFKIPTRKVRSGTTIQIAMKTAGIFAKGDNPVAVAVTVTAPGATTIGHVTAYPCASGKPVASTLNLQPGRAVPNSAIVPMDKNGNICLYTVGTTDLLMDISGYFTAGGAGLKFASVAPVRAVDTRGLPAKFNIKGRRSANQSTKVPMSTLGVYGKNAPKAVVINMTAAGATAPGHANVYPCSSKSPNTSINNYLPGSARASGAIATLGGGNMCMFNLKPVNLVVDVSGYFY